MDKKLWNRWLQNYSSSNAKKLVIDGIVSEEKYQNTSPRLLFVLKEPNSKDGLHDGDDLRRLFRETPKGSAAYRLGEWAQGLLNNFPSFDEVETKETIKAALKKIAVINLKKLPGGGSASPDIEKYCFQDRFLLREQITSINPDIIIACGTFYPLCWVLEDEIPSGISADDKFIKLKSGRKLIKWQHPAARREKRGWYEEFKLSMVSP